jgi:hypothetical protein
MKIAMSILLAGTALSMLSAPASARGCNGVVNQFEWGCAAWDNNNGPQFPHYKAPAQPARVAPPPAAANRSPQVVNRNGSVGNAGGTLISPGNRNGNGIVAQGGGN